VARRESPRLAVTWDGKPVDNLCVCRIGLWNEGNGPITQDRLPKSDPLRIVAPKHTHILASEIANISRQNLPIEARPTTTTQGQDAVDVQITGGDALEKLDGVAVRVFFTGDCTATFRPQGRVIGAPAGFVKSGRREKTPSDLLPILFSYTATIALVIVILVLEAWYRREGRRQGDRASTFHRSRCTRRQSDCGC
jgi:hypothetical protein